MDESLDRAYRAALKPLLADESVRSMQTYRQHGDTDTRAHCLLVGYLGLRLGAALRLRPDVATLARGAMLHDLYLYDWHSTPKRYSPHAFTHPQTALDNARARFALNPREENVIRSHMWPLTLLHPPRCREAWLVCLADKIAAVAETFRLPAAARHAKL